MSGSPARRPAVEDLVDAYRNDLQAAGMFAGHPVTSVARMFFTRVGPGGWARLPLAAQCALPLKDRRVVGWLIVTGRLRPSPDYLVACRPYLGEVAARHHRAFYERFAATSAELGFDPIVTRLQWSALAKVTAVAGLGPGQVTQAVIDEGRQALTAAIGRHRPGSHGPKALSAALFGLQTTLFHLGVLGTAPRKTNRDRSAERAAQWASAPPQLASTLAGYIAQVRLSLRASTMVRVEGVLREFACWLAGNAPEVAASPTFAVATSRPTSCTWPAGRRPAAGNCPRSALPSISAPCAPASSGSPSGTATTSPPRCVRGDPGGEVGGGGAGRGSGGPS